MAYSAGFSPHPKVSYSGAAPTGVASEAEYLEIALSERCAPERLRVALDRSLPSGLDILDVVEVSSGSLAERLEASVWEIQLPGVSPSDAAAAATAFLAAPSVEVSRLTKNGTRTFDARAAVLALSVLQRAEPGAGPPYAILRVVVQHLTPAVRPDDVLVGLRQIGDLEPPVTPAVTRLAQGPRDERSDALAELMVSDPLAPDRVPSA
jgi:radical SAM-linked protein